MPQLLRPGWEGSSLTTPGIDWDHSIILILNILTILMIILILIILMIILILIILRITIMMMNSSQGGRVLGNSRTTPESGVRSPDNRVDAELS